MTPSESKRVDRRDFIITAIAIVFGLTVAGVSLMQVTVDDRPQLAQVMPLPADQNKKSDPPAPLNPESSPKDPTSRPTTPPPQPARPDADAQNKGARPVLPPAPAEKSGPSIDAK